MRPPLWIGPLLLVLAAPAAAQDVSGDGGLDGGISDTEICDNCSPAVVDFEAWDVGPQERQDAGLRQRRARPDAGIQNAPESGGFGCSTGVMGLEPLFLLGLLRRRKKR